MPLGKAIAYRFSLAFAEELVGGDEDVFVLKFDGERFRGGDLIEVGLEQRESTSREAAAIWTAALDGRTGIKFKPNPPILHHVSRRSIAKAEGTEPTRTKLTADERECTRMPVGNRLRISMESGKEEP